MTQPTPEAKQKFIKATDKHSCVENSTVLGNEFRRTKRAGAFAIL